MAAQKNTPAKFTAAERKIRAVALRRAGVAFADIGKAIGISKQRAHKIVVDEMAALNEKLAEETAALRRLEAERLDALFVPVYRRATNSAGDVEATYACLKLMERRAKLFGLDSPTKYEDTGNREFTIRLPEGIPDDDPEDEEGE